MKQKVTGYCTLVLYQNFQAPKQADQLGVATNSPDARDRIGEFLINLGQGLGFSWQVYPPEHVRFALSFAACHKAVAA
jgi:hypothetical protein